MTTPARLAAEQRRRAHRAATLALYAPAADRRTAMARAATARYAVRQTAQTARANETAARAALDAATELVVGHIEPVAVVRALDPEVCPYCAAFPDLPCAVHLRTGRGVSA